MERHSHVLPKCTNEPHESPSVSSVSGKCILLYDTSMTCKVSRKGIGKQMNHIRTIVISVHSKDSKVSSHLKWEAYRTHLCSYRSRLEALHGRAEQGVWSLAFIVFSMTMFASVSSSSAKDRATEELSAVSEFAHDSTAAPGPLQDSPSANICPSSRVCLCLSTCWHQSAARL